MMKRVDGIQNYNCLAKRLCAVYICDFFDRAYSPKMVKPIY